MKHLRGKKCCEGLGEVLGWTSLSCSLWAMSVVQLLVQCFFMIHVFSLSAFLFPPTCLAKYHLLAHCFHHW